NQRHIWGPPQRRGPHDLSRLPRAVAADSAQVSPSRAIAPSQVPACSRWPLPTVLAVAVEGDRALPGAGLLEVALADRAGRRRRGVVAAALPARPVGADGGGERAEREVDDQPAGPPAAGRRVA